MPAILVVYASRHGHVQRIAEHIAGLLELRGLDAVTIDAAKNNVHVSAYCAAVLASPIHYGRHLPEMAQFIDHHRAELEEIPTAFLSVGYFEAVAENEDLPAGRRARAAEEVARTMDHFFEKTGWHPDRARPVAGALMYREYGVVVRWLMKQAARVTGAETDTSKNHVYTDWSGLEAFVDGFVSHLPCFLLACARSQVGASA